MLERPVRKRGTDDEHRKVADDRHRAGATGRAHDQQHRQGDDGARSACDN